MYQQEQPRSIPSGQIPTPPQQQQREDKPQIQVPSPEPQQSQFSSPPLPQPRALPAGRTHSIFTPIDDNRSMLMRHWAVSETSSDLPKSDKEKESKDPPRSQTLDVNHMKRNQVNGNMVNGKQNPPPTSNPPPRTNSTPTLPSITPLGRTNSITMDLKRPRLKVQIPIDQSDDEANTGTGADMSDNRNPANILTPIRDPGLTPGPVLPPPSPSASALLSAGATGPPNPFARPLHPVPNCNGGGGSQRGNGDGRGGDLDTPISALPSRFMSDNLLPSPSSFYNEWGFGRGGIGGGSGSGIGGSGSVGGGAGEGSSAGGAGNGSNNLLPSPLTFQTPVNALGPSFRDGSAPGAADDAKRKLGEEDVAGAKRIKT
jgi:transcription factor RLM1